MHSFFVTTESESTYTASGDLASVREGEFSTYIRTGYEILGGLVWKVETRFQSAGGITNTLSITREQLTGLDGVDGELLTRWVETENEKGEVVRTSVWVAPELKRVREIKDRPRSVLPVISESFCGQVVMTVSETGVINRFAYNGFKEQTSQLDGRGNCIDWAYNGQGLVSVARNAEGNETRYGYDAFGNRTAVVDPMSNAVESVCSPEGLLLSIAGADYPVWRSYDGMGRLRNSETTRDGIVRDQTVWMYDGFTGLMTNKVYADGSAVRFGYRTDGKLANRRRSRDAEVQYGYDAAGNTAVVVYSDGTPAVGMAYDGFNRLVAAESSGFTNAYVYAGSELTYERQSGTLLERGYGVDSRTESLKMLGYAVTNLYDGFGRRCGVTARIGGASISVARDCSGIGGCPSSERIAGMERVFTYEANRDLLRKVENPCSNWEYKYDAAGRRSRRIDDGTFTNVFLYNARSEVVGADQNGTMQTYGYDEIGNRTDFQANSLNQYSAPGFAYDEDGNMLSDGNWSYAWDGENRLSEIVPTLATNGSWKVRMRYDHLGRMVVMERSAFFGDWIDEKRTRFVWDRGNPIAEFEVDRQTGDTNSTYYLWGPDISRNGQEAGGIGGLLAVVRNGQAYVPWYDGNGNVTEYTDTNGVVVARYRYDVFGKIIEEDGPLSDSFRFRFSTKYHEPVSGLVLYQKRAYCPDLGRWLNRDPIGEDGGLNLYAFCGNNPMDRFDALGLYTVDDARDSLKKQGVTPNKKGFWSDSYSDTLVFDEWLRLEKTNGSWWTKLPKCPGKICIRKDGTIRNPDPAIWEMPERGGYLLGRNHPGAAYEMRTKASTRNCGNQCTYGEAGKLITAMPAAGTVDFYSPNNSKFSHYAHDVESFDFAVKLSRIRDYYLVRPSW